MSVEARPWFDSYPAGIPRSIDLGRYASLADLCLKSCAAHAEREACTNLGARLSFAEIERKSRDFAAYLTSGLGLQRGDRVAVMLPNLLQSPIVLIAILRAGLIVVNVNPLYKPRELEHQMRDSGARAIVVLENFASTVEKTISSTSLEHVVVTRVGDCLGGIKGWIASFLVRYVRRQVPAFSLPQAVRFSAAMTAGRGLAYSDPQIAADDPAFLQYTGGTTGVSKGATLSHKNVMSNVLQLTAWVGPFIDARNDVVLTPLPLYHIFALTVNLLAFLELGAKNVLITNPRDIDALVAEMDKHKVAFVTGVNTLFNALIHSRQFDKVDFSRLKIVLAGGMAVQRDVADRWAVVTGVPILQGYGLTEASPVVSASPLDIKEFNGSIGLPLPDTDVVILGDDGKPVPPGTAGELCVKGPQVMVGYWERPEETAETFTDDGWLKTGDIARMDEHGFLYIEDRKKDVIIVSGFNVYPNEIEDVVTSHPGVLEAAAIGVPDPRSGEAVKVFVVKRDQSLTKEEVFEFCRERLTGYKSPDQIEFIDELPKSNVGKVLRRQLKA